jgi:hypothetical protein
LFHSLLFYNNSWGKHKTFHTQNIRVIVMIKQAHKLSETLSLQFEYLYKVTENVKIALIKDFWYLHCLYAIAGVQNFPKPPYGNGICNQLHTFRYVFCVVFCCCSAWFVREVREGQKRLDYLFYNILWCNSMLCKGLYFCCEWLLSFLCKKVYLIWFRECVEISLVCNFCISLST